MDPNVLNINIFHVRNKGKEEFIENIEYFYFDESYEKKKKKKKKKKF